MHYTGADTITLINLAATGHGLTLLPESALPETELRQRGIAAVHVTTPRLGHRMELIHTALPQSSPAAALAAILSQH
jgi:DNA-binding transcriptional LysR family regulator